MQKKKAIRSNTIAVSLVQDTLLFLVFISISAMILSPALIQSTPHHSSTHRMIDTRVQDALQTVLSTTTSPYSYRSGIGFIDSFAETFGIDTNQSEGLYASLTTHFLGKQQYHKTIAQLITEQLATQYRITLNESVIQLNPFSGDSLKQLTEVISIELTKLLPPSTSFNFTAVYQPIHDIPFGGRISIGKPVPPSVSTYSSYQTLSMPFLPCITLQNKRFCFSSYHLKQSAEHILQDVKQFQNITCIHYETANFTEEDRFTLIAENLSSFFEDMLLYGVVTTNNSLLFPSVIDIVLSPVFSLDSFSLTDTTYHQNNDSTTMFQTVNSFFDSCVSEEFDDFSFDVSSFVISRFAETIQDQIQGIVLLVAEDFIMFIKDHIASFIQPLFAPYVQKLTTLLVTSNQSLLDFITNSIDIIFANLSLSKASISLTIWEG